MDTNEVLVLVFLGTFILLLFTGFPIAWILGGLSLIFAALAIYGNRFFGWDTYFLDGWNDYTSVIQRIGAQMENWVLVALPMFIFMGLMLDRSGIAEKMMTNFIRLFGRFRGGLAVGVIVIGILLAASTGIVGASVVLLATMSMPIMLAENYSKSFASGVVASAGTLGILIPPSIMLILMADQISLPVGETFMGALIPGLLLGVLYIIYAVIAAQVNPRLAPAPQDLPPISGKLIWATLISVVPALLLILAVLGSIFLGIATPTEASGLGALGATLLAIVNRRFNLTVLREVCYQTTLTTAFIFGIFIGATAFALVMRALGGDDFIGRMLQALPFGPSGIVVFILLLAFALGFFLDWLEITLIFLPLVAPVIVALGFDAVWFVVLFAVTLQTSFITPPVGFSLFYLKGVVPPGVSTMDIYRGIIPFVVLQLLAVTMVFLFPQLVLWLPELMYSN